MTEEKKEDVKETAAAASAPVANAADKTAPAEKKPDTAKEAPKKEKPLNCTACNKPIKRKCWYYRNGKYFCNKRCWTTTLKKEEPPKEA